jgi:hypothetical protein
MKKVIRLTESDLMNIVKKVLKESGKNMLMEAGPCPTNMGGGSCDDPQYPSCVTAGVSSGNPTQHCCPEDYGGEISNCTSRGLATSGVKVTPSKTPTYQKPVYTKPKSNQTKR